MKTRWIRLPFLIPRWAVAQVLLPRTIFYRGELTEDVIAHELGHVHQIEDYGLLTYWFTYLMEQVKYGYAKNALESDADYRARELMSEARLVQWAITQKGNKRWTTVML